MDSRTYPDPQQPVSHYLREKHRRIKTAPGFPESLALRVHRSLSWLGLAEDEFARENPTDICFISLWIAFNASYAARDDYPYGDNKRPKERNLLRTHFDSLVSKDPGRRIYNGVWERFSDEIRILLDNQYIYAPFWNYQNGDEKCANWSSFMQRDSRIIKKALRHQDTVRILSVLFDRLYVLRNQIMHGGATYNSNVNRDQLRDGAAVMKFLLPIFIEIMMDNPQHDWREPPYPVVN